MMQTFWLLVLFEMLNFPPRVSGTRAGLCVLALLDLVPTLRRLSETMPKWSPDLHTICISKACVFNTCIYGINTFNNVFTAMKCSIIPVFTATTCSMHCVYGNDMFNTCVHSQGVFYSVLISKNVVCCTCIITNMLYDTALSSPTHICILLTKQMQF